ncbi:hypothetical protein QVD17_41738 [Tagetes erecta]|uniref:BED-type domain-containing protein n=1 Tax=Tagetes erecta TaxID=13708 RepID=A0AAD8N936_TARER|nr:hypothetical protein QVD17_41738 [Tagetes erecta]
MVFGSQSQKTTDETETHVSETQRTYIDLEDEVVQQSSAAGTGCRSKKSVEDKDSLKPLFDEVTFHGAGNSKNPGGSKQWTCNHCKGKFTSTYTRIHVHFFGAVVGKKAEIKRYPMVLRDRGLYGRLFSKVKEAENSGVSKGLKHSVLSKNAPSKKGIEETFAILERKEVDSKIVRGLCANGIPFNVLRNPQFLEMISAIKNAPAGYKPPSSEKARSNLLDECYRDVKKDLTPIKDTCKNWDVNPESAYIEGSSSRMDEMVWEDLDEENNENGKGKRKRLD